MSGNDPSSIRRRTVLKSVGAASTGIAASTLTVAAEELSDTEQKRMITEALADKQVKRLIRQYDSIGRIRHNDASVTRVIRGDNSIHFVRIPYEVNEVGTGPDSAEIIWSDIEKTPPTAVQTKEENTTDELSIKAYLPSTSSKENTFETSITYNDGEKDEVNNQLHTMQATPTGPAGMCGYSEVPNLSCGYNWIDDNEEVGESCSMFSLTAGYGVVPLAIASGFWCMWRLHKEGIDPQGCDLCTDDLDEAASGLPIDPSDIPTDPDDFPDRPSWDDIPSLPIPW